MTHTNTHMIVCAHSNIYTLIRSCSYTHARICESPTLTPSNIFANCAISVNAIMHYLCVAMQQTVWLSFQNCIKREMGSFKIMSNQTSDVHLSKTVYAVYTKAKQSLISLHRCWLRGTEKDSSILLHPEIKPLPLGTGFSFQCVSLSGSATNLCWMP